LRRSIRDVYDHVRIGLENRRHFVKDAASPGRMIALLKSKCTPRRINFTGAGGAVEEAAAVAEAVEAAAEVPAA